MLDENKIMESSPLFSLQNVTIFRGRNGKKRLVLSQVFLNLEPSELVDVSGASGAGKSTLLEAAAWLIPIAEGNMTLEGRKYTAFSPPEWRRKVALYLQTPVAAPGSVRENLLLPWRFTRKPYHEMPSKLHLESELEEVGLSEVSLDARASELSGGQLARLALVRLVLLKPRVLLLDEPEASLDRDSARLVSGRVRRYLKENQAAAIRIRHFAWDEPASRTLTVREGKVFEEV